MSRLYCYVDESGQDTKGRLFVVGIVLVSSPQEEVSDACSHIEQVSGKNNSKWRQTAYPRRLAYLRQIFDNNLLHGKLFYCVWKDTVDFDAATIMSIAGAVKIDGLADGTALSVYVDGLSKAKRHEYSNRLRRLGVSAKNLRGVSKDENNVFIRVADALAGFVRDALESTGGDIHALFIEAKQSSALVEVEGFKE